MLHLLDEYAKSHGLVAEPGFAPKTVRWAVAFAAGGQFLGVLSLGDAGQGREFKRCPDMTQGELIRGGTTRSHFLWDSAQVVARFGKEEDGETEDLQEKHKYFANQLISAAEAMPELGAVGRALLDCEVERAVREALVARKAKPTDKCTVLVDGTLPLESDGWHEWWRKHRRESRSGPKDVEDADGLCLIEGVEVRAAPTHSTITGLSRQLGGDSKGNKLVAFDKDAYRSFGFNQGANACISEAAAASYRAALNELIKRGSVTLGGVLVAHWFEREVTSEDDPLSWLVEPSSELERDARERARKTLGRIRTGEGAELGSNRFYGLTLSGASGRVMVRDWMEGRFEGLLEAVHRWFEDLSIVHLNGGRTAKDPKFLAVAGSTVRELKYLPPEALRNLWRAAVMAGPIPRSMAVQALLRARSAVLTDEPASHARMGLLKAYLLRLERKETMGNDNSELRAYVNPDHPHAAYQSGRLMALLAALQRRALGDVGAGVVQRYYAAASTTPALVFGRLVRTAQFHLNKLEPGLAWWFEGRMGEITSRLGDEIPKVLSLEEQTLFALGYYQQQAEMRAKRQLADEQVEEKDDE
jgi:CRISPR-associated protein Csd1